jgi:hypothetical protein
MARICQRRNKSWTARAKVIADLTPESSTIKENKGPAADAQETKVTQQRGTTGAWRYLIDTITLEGSAISHGAETET